MPFDFTKEPHWSGGREPSNIYISHPFSIDPQEQDYSKLEISPRLIHLSGIQSPKFSLFIPQFQSNSPIKGLSEEDRIGKLESIEPDDWIFMQYLPRKTRRFELI